MGACSSEQRKEAKGVRTKSSKISSNENKTCQKDRMASEFIQIHTHPSIEDILREEEQKMRKKQKQKKIEKQRLRLFMKYEKMHEQI